MTNKKFVEVGRMVEIQQGSFQNKHAMIVSIVDQNRVLVCNPMDKIPRRIVNLKSIKLTNTKAKIEGHPNRKAVLEAFKTGKIQERISESRVVKKQRFMEQRRNASDFERFSLRKARQTRASIAKKITNA
ncbi:60S ribosomal protein L14-like protein [Perkinsela sp. CCAP 1560/4]|nr:60S ribosomal protein L14-like protein [Perkinsela sp. CCAP 1560/4]KNH04177.1 60S ribosomal protein L14-like protein [Perkinsela sp. CCAP 1560/4]|eukprot:KNH03608.1 60S ribosomal protein L14-like protein [Perkinsela sp. CCAP 1560/4]